MHSGGRRNLKIALVGQPNCGKSTLFNAVAGYRSITANYPGATVSYTISTTRVDGILIELVDLPGIYSLTGTSQIEVATRNYIVQEDFDGFINVLDASMLARGLELTLQLMEYRKAMVICLNMIDDARIKGIDIDSEKLSKLFGSAVTPTIATHGRGIQKLLQVAVKVTAEQKLPNQLHGQKDVEDVITELSKTLESSCSPLPALPSRLLALRLLEEEEEILPLLSSGEKKSLSELKHRLEELHDCESYVVVHAQRHALAMSLAEDVSTVGPPLQNFREKLDRILMHPFWGYAVLLLTLYLFFTVIFTSGAYLEGRLSALFAVGSDSVKNHISQFPFLIALWNGFFQGVAGGITLVLPYLIPFLIGLSFLEDLGYLPRVAFLMDAFMHKMGLHGTSLLPAILGYGCNVPAVMATRILHTRRDKIIAAVISTLVPCSARTIVILGLVGYYLGPGWAFAMYGFNILVVAATGRVMSRLLPQLTPGMVMEIPRYQVPSFGSILKKTWFRIRDFIVVAWPLLITGSIILSIGEYYHVNRMVDQVLSPLTVGILGLPIVVGTTLILGVLRKELSLLMLTTALGTADIQSVLTSQQIVVFTVFVMFYIPCVATLGIMIRETGARITAYTAIYTMALATCAGFLARLFFTLY